MPVRHVGATDLLILISETGPPAGETHDSSEGGLSHMRLGTIQSNTSSVSPGICRWRNVQ